MSAALVGDGLANLELVTRVGERPSECVHHFREGSGSRTLCGHTCDDDGAYGDWVADPDAHPEDACGYPGDACSSCDASYRKAARISRGGPARKPDTRPAYKRDNAYPRIRPVKVAKRAETAPAADVFRMFGRELEALGTPEAVAELKRRKANRAAKRNARAKATA